MTTRFINTVAALSLIAGMAVPALAQSPSPAPSGTPKMMERRAATTVDLACMKTAAEKRDNAMLAAFDTFRVNVKKALETRRDAFKAAWDITDRNERKKAIRAAWAAFDASSKKARRELDAAKKSAWSAHRTEAKQCKGQGEDTRASEGNF